MSSDLALLTVWWGDWVLMARSVRVPGRYRIQGIRVDLAAAPGPTGTHRLTRVRLSGDRQPGDGGRDRVSLVGQAPVALECGAISFSFCHVGQQPRLARWGRPDWRLLSVWFASWVAALFLLGLMSRGVPRLADGAVAEVVVEHADRLLPFSIEWLPGWASTVGEPMWCSAVNLYPQGRAGLQVDLKDWRYWPLPPCPRGTRASTVEAVVSRAKRAPGPISAVIDGRLEPWGEEGLWLLAPLARGTVENALFLDPSTIAGFQDEADRRGNLPAHRRVLVRGQVVMDEPGPKVLVEALCEVVPGTEPHGVGREP